MCFPTLGASMPVILEGTSVVVRCDSINCKVEGGWERFLKAVPNPMFCTDSEIARVSFMYPRDAEIFVGQLQALGLEFTRDNEAIDLTVVNQARGLNVSTPWLTVGWIKLPEIGGRVCIGPSTGTLSGPSDAKVNIVAPSGWKYEHSLSKTGAAVGGSEGIERLKFLRSQDGVDVYWDVEQGRETYAARTYQATNASPDSEVRVQTIADDVSNGQEHNALFEKAARIVRDTNVFQYTPGASLGWYDRRRVESAIGFLDKVIEINPYNWSAFWLKGKSLQALERYPESLESFAKAWLLNPSNTDTAREAGISATEAGDFNSAIYYAAEALKLKPTEAGLRANLALAYLFAGNLVAASKEIDVAFNSNPRDPISTALFVLVHEVVAGRMRRPSSTRDIDQTSIREAISRFLTERRARQSDDGK